MKGNGSGGEGRWRTAGRSEGEDRVEGIGLYCMRKKFEVGKTSGKGKLENFQSLGSGMLQ